MSGDPVLLLLFLFFAFIAFPVAVIYTFRSYDRRRKAVGLTHGSFFSGGHLPTFDLIRRWSVARPILTFTAFTLFGVLIFLSGLRFVGIGVTTFFGLLLIGFATGLTPRLPASYGHVAAPRYLSPDEVEERKHSAPQWFRLLVILAAVLMIVLMLAEVLYLDRF